MTIDQSIEFMDIQTSNPFSFTDDFDAVEFEDFLMTDPDPDKPEIHKKSILHFLDMLLKSGGDYEMEMIIYKVLARL